MKVTCPGCGASFEVPETVKTITCPYCGLVFGEKVREDHYYFPAIREEPYRILLGFLKRQFGIPIDIELNSSLLDQKLYYVPVYFYYMSGKATGICGRRETVAYVCHHEGIVASTGFQGLLADYPFPIRGKRFFKKELEKFEGYREPEFGEDRSRELAEEILKRKLVNELHKQCEDLDRVIFEDLRLDYRGLVHYPIYHLKYSYKGKSYEAYLDGSDGKVILAEHPLKLETRIVEISTAIGIISAALVIGSILSSMIHTIIPMLTSIIPAVASSFPLLKRGVELRATASELKVLTDEQSRSPIKILTKLI